MSEKYNGWTNYETWAVKLWIDNEEFTQRYWEKSAKKAWREADATENWTRTESAIFTLADQLKDEITDPDACELLGQSNLYTDLLNAALSEVNWQEIAGNMLEGIAVEEESEEEEAV